MTTTSREVRDLPILDAETWLIVPRVGVACPRCGPTVEAVSWLDRYAQGTPLRCGRRLPAAVAIDEPGFAKPRFRELHPFVIRHRRRVPKQAAGFLAGVHHGARLIGNQGEISVESVSGGSVVPQVLGAAQ